MTTPDNNAPLIDDRAEWVDPEISTLALSETAMMPGRGFDRGNFRDCTLS